MGEFWLGEVERFRQDNPNHEPGGAVMVGDSITAAFPATAFFPGVHIVNRGISGDRLIGVIARRSESIFDLRPRKVFLLVGVNDVALFPDMPITEFERQYRFLFDQIRTNCPEVEVFVQTIMPIRGQYAPANARVLQVNALLRRLAGAYSFHCIDLHGHFTNAQGEMREAYSDDGVHPNMTGAAVWAELLRPYLCH